MKFKHIDTCWYFNKLDHRGKPYEWPCCGESTECDEKFVNALKEENARFRKALEKYANPETHSMDENGFVWSGDFFDYKTARDALEGKK